MTNKQYAAKEYLSNVRYGKYEIKSLLDEISELESYVLRINPNIHEEKVDTGKYRKNVFEERMIAYMQKKEKAENKIKVLISTIDSIEECINKVVDKKISSVLRFRYINGYKWEDIAKDMGYTSRQLRNMHLKGLDIVYKLIP